MTRVSLLTLSLVAAACASGCQRPVDEGRKDAVFRNRAVDVDVAQGTVTLAGTVVSERERDRATDMVALVPGVKRVVNELGVGTP